MLRELRGVEERARSATQKALADLAGVYERELAKRDETIRDLQTQSLEAATADSELARQLAQLRLELGTTITTVVTHELSKRFPDRAETVEIAQGASRGARVAGWAGSLTVVVAAVVTGIVMGVQRGCSEPNTTSAPVPTVRQAEPGVQH